MSDDVSDFKKVAAAAREVWEGWPDIRFKLKPETCHSIREDIIASIIDKAMAKGVSWFRARLEAANMVQLAEGGWVLELRIPEVAEVGEQLMPHPDSGRQPYACPPALIRQDQKR